MKNKIISEFPQSAFFELDSNPIFVVDFTHRTEKYPADQRKGVEIHSTQPVNPNNPAQNMPCFIINNPNNTSVLFNIFSDSQFKDANGNYIKHGEGCFFPTLNDEKSWFCIIEIKDCLKGKVSKYIENVKEKAINMFDFFKKNNLFPNNPVYFIASFPRKLDLDQTIFDNYVELKKHKKTYVIASNSMVVENNRIIYFGS